MVSLSCRGTNPVIARLPHTQTRQPANLEICNILATLEVREIKRYIAQHKIQTSGVGGCRAGWHQSASWKAEFVAVPIPRGHGSYLGPLVPGYHPEELPSLPCQLFRGPNQSLPVRQSNQVSNNFSTMWKFRRINYQSHLYSSQISTHRYLRDWLNKINYLFQLPKEYREENDYWITSLYTYS